MQVYRTRLLHPRVTTKPPPLPDTSWTFLWGWILHVLSLDEQTLYDTAGLDALYFDRSNRLCLTIAAFVAAVNLGGAKARGFRGSPCQRRPQASQIERLSTSEI